MPENINKIIKSIIQDIQVEMTDEFDQNFERQAFFSEAEFWCALSMKPVGATIKIPKRQFIDKSLELTDKIYAVRYLMR